MSDLKELTNELMLDPDFKREYEALQPEMDIARENLAETMDSTLKIKFDPKKMQVH